MLIYHYLINIFKQTQYSIYSVQVSFEPNQSDLCFACNVVRFVQYLRFLLFLSFTSNTIFFKTGHMLWTDTLLVYPAAHGSWKSSKTSKCFKVFAPSHLCVCMTKISSLKHTSLHAIDFQLNHLQTLPDWLICSHAQRQVFNRPVFLSAVHWLRWSAGATCSLGFLCGSQREKISLVSVSHSYWKINTLEAPHPGCCDWCFCVQWGHPSKHVKAILSSCSEVPKYWLTSNKNGLVSNS